MPRKNKKSSKGASGLLWRIWDNFYSRQIILAISVVVLGLLVVNLWLMIYTRHGKTFELPNFIGLTFADAKQLAVEKGLRIEISDSVFVANKPRGSVIEQYPKPNVRVKSDRAVFITTNAMSPKKERMPDVTGLSLRQAKATIEMQGLEIGRLSFASDMASGNVLAQLYRGNPIAPDALLDYGSKVDLVLGRNRETESTALPQLKGLSLQLAKSSIIEASLNVGAIKYDASVATAIDSLEAKVYAQYPPAGEGISLEVGSAVDIFLTINAARLGE